MNLHAASNFMDRAQNTLLRFTLMLALLTAVCVGANAIEREEASKQITASLEKWKAIKEKCGGNYSYSVHFENKLGFGHDTVIVVSNNQLAERKFTQWKKENGTPKQTDTWTEQGDKIGSHKKGAEAKTLDELYDSALNFLQKPPRKFFQLEIAFDQQGLLQRCRCFDTRFKEDAPAYGIDIASIQLVEGK